MLRLHTSEDYSISIKLGTQRTLPTLSPPVAKMSSGRCSLFSRSLPTRRVRVYSLLLWHFPPVCYVPSPCSLRLNNRKGTIILNYPNNELSFIKDASKEHKGDGSFCVLVRSSPGTRDPVSSSSYTYGSCTLWPPRQYRRRIRPSRSFVPSPSGSRHRMSYPSAQSGRGRK